MMIGWKSPQHEPSLDELLADEMMCPVMRSAGLDAAQLRRKLLETARRLERKGANAHSPRAAA